MQKRCEQSPRVMKVASKTHEDFNEISQLYHETSNLPSQRAFLHSVTDS